MRSQLTSVDIVVPVYNEEKVLAQNIRILHAYLSKASVYDWTIIIADNASIDNTSSVAKNLGHELNRLRYMHINKKGRGLALKRVFCASQADIVSYMDIDLSTNLKYFNLLIDGLTCGFDVATGSRLLTASQVKRSFKREFLSRSYNSLIHLLFGNRFSDAQCGFKAIRTAIARRLIPYVQNEHWFFDTELLLLAEKSGYRILDVPVQWIDDLDSRVDLIPTIMEDLRGLLRMRRSISRMTQSCRRLSHLHLDQV